jgi:hypothetical protein
MKQMYGCLITAVVIHCVLDTNLRTEITSSYLFFFLGFLCGNNIRGTKHQQCRENINRHIHLTQVNH